MLSQAVALSIVMEATLVTVWPKLPKRMREFLVRNHLVAEFAVALMTFTVLGGSITALTAGVLVGLLTTGALYVANNPTDFQYLYDLLGLAREKLEKLKNELKRLGTEYRLAHPKPIAELSNG